jgi:putative transposon-encoded protein
VGTYTFGNVTANAAIEITFTQNGVTPPTPLDAPDLADGSWGDDAWSGVWDEGKNGSKLNITKQGEPLTANWTLGQEPSNWGTVPDEDIPYVGIGFFDGDWSGVTKVEIKYSVNQPTYMALNSENGHEYYVELQTGNNRTMTITPSEFKIFEWDGGSHSLILSEVEGISLSAFDTYGSPQTNLTVTSLIVYGLIFDDEDDDVEEDDDDEEEQKPIAIAQNKTKTVSSVGVSLVNGNINLSLPTSASKANIVLFDVRGRILFERSVTINGNFASVALPKSFLHNQAVILQVKTNSGFNMTKRILIK